MYLFMAGGTEGHKVPFESLPVFRISGIVEQIGPICTAVARAESAALEMRQFPSGSRTTG